MTVAGESGRGRGRDASATGATARPRRARTRFVVLGVVAVAIAVAVVVATTRSGREVQAAEGHARLPAVPTHPVAERWTLPVDRPLHDLLVAGDRVVVVERAPLRQGLPPGVLLSSHDAVDGRRAWQRRVPGRSLVVLRDGQQAALVDVAGAFDVASTVRGLSLVDGRETWDQPAEGATTLAWGPGDAVVLVGPDCRALTPVSGEPVETARASTETACTPPVVAPSSARVMVDGRRLVVEVDAATPPGSRARIVDAATDRVVATLPGSEDVLLDPVDDLPLGGQLTAGGLLVPGPDTASGTSSGVTLYGLPELQPRWTVAADEEVVRVAADETIVVVATTTDDGRLVLRAFR